jgi:hypothetical protein
MVFVLTAVGLAITQGCLTDREIKFSQIDIGSHFQNSSIHEGNLTIGGNATFLIENCQFNLTGKLIVKDAAEVIIRNATFISNWNTSEEPERGGGGTEYRRTRHLIVENQAKLTVLNSDLILNTSYPLGDPRRWVSHAFILYDQAIMNITGSKIIYTNGNGDVIYAYSTSKLWMRDITMSTFKPENTYDTNYPKSALVTYDRSEAEVQNSTIDEVGVYGNCTVNFSNSSVEYFQTMSDSSRVSITDSTISQLRIFGPDSKVWLTNTSIEELVVRGNSKVWLHDSSIKENWGWKSRIWVVWDWPLFGQVSIPYTWAPYIVPVIVTAITSTLIAITVAFLFLRRRKRREEITEENNLSKN